MNEDKGATTKKPSSAIPTSLATSYFLAYVVILLLCVILVAHATRSKEQYFVVDVADNTTEIFPMNEPNVTPSALLKWATQAATSVYTIDFFHYQSNIDALKDYFTVAGYQDFLQSLNASGSLKRIINNKLIVSAVATDTAVILQEGPLRDVYTWRIQVPLLLTYQGASTTSTQKTIAVSLLVTRVPTDQAPKGIGIAQIVDSELHGET